MKVAMTPKERMLLYLLCRLSKPNWGATHRSTGPRVEYRGHEVGDLVICQTSGRFGVHPFMAGHIVEKRTDSDCLIRELGGDHLCWVANEMFYPVRGLEGAEDLLPEKQYRFNQKVHKAFRRGGSYSHLSGGVDFEPDGTATIFVREKWGGHYGKDTSGRRLASVPYSVNMAWTAKTTINAILARLREGGYDVREFETRPETLEG